MCDPYLLGRPLLSPLGGRDLVVGMVWGAWRGVQLVELSFDEALQLGPVLALERTQVFKPPLYLLDLALDSLTGAD